MHNTLKQSADSRVPKLKKSNESIRTYTCMLNRTKNLGKFKHY